MALLLPQTRQSSDTKRFVLSWTSRSSFLSSHQTLVPLELSSAAMTDRLPTSPNFLSPIELETYVSTNGEWKLNQWSVPLSEMLTQSRGNDQSVVVDVQLGDAMNVTVSQLIVQADTQPQDVNVSLVFGNNALSGLKELKQVHVVSMKTTLENKWLPEGVKLNRLVFDDATVEKLELETSVTIEQVVIRHCNLSFPTAVLELDTAVESLILEHNTIAGPIVLTKNEHAQLLNISDFKAIANTVESLDSGFTSCVKEETIGGLTICIANDVQSAGSSLISWGVTGSLETQSPNTTTTRDASSVRTIMLASACTLALVVVLSFFHRFKKKASKFVDERLTFSNREDGLLAGGKVETGSRFAITGDAKILADIDLGKDQVLLHKKLGTHSLWLGVYKKINVVALKFVPHELNMSMKELNAVRISYVPFRHDNIVRFLGSSWTDREEVLIVVEHMSMGSLRSVLADAKVDLSWPKRLQMSKDICSGLNFVRSIQGTKLSRNLTARTVLLDAQSICKLDIFDYASSLRTESVPARSFGNGDIVSRAPELLKGDKITVAAEVYALGVIFCEISSRSKLFQCVSEERGSTMADIFIATEVIARRLEPLPAEDAPADFQELALRCIRYEPSERPKLSEIFSMISECSI